MKIGYFTVEGENCFYEISSLLEAEIKKNFKTEIVDGVIFFTEDFSFMNSSDLMTVVRIQKIKSDEKSCEVEIVSGGGGDGLLSLTFGNEKRRLSKIVDLLTDFCKYKKYYVSEFISK
ncbi:MAG: hypothetical protein ABI675_30530 [Chitinophagaceae bacterium]